jgi:uncharacterized membrane protein
MKMFGFIMFGMLVGFLLIAGQWAVALLLVLVALVLGLYLKGRPGDAH